MASTRMKAFTVLLSCLVLFLSPNLETMPISIIPALLRQEDNYTQLCKSDSNIVTTGEDYQGNVSSNLPHCSLYESENLKLSILFGISGVIEIVVTPFFCLLIDKTVPLVAIVFSLGNDVIAYLLYAFGNSYWHYLLGRGFNAVAVFAAYSGVYSAIFDVFTDVESRRKVIGVVNIFACTGEAFGPAFGGAVYQFAGQAVAFLSPLPFVAVCVILTIPLAQEEIKRKNEKKTIEEIAFNEDALNESILSEKPVKPTSIFRLLIDPYIMISVVALSLSTLGIECMGPTLSVWMRLELKAEEYQQGIIWLPSMAFSCLGTFVATILGHYYSGKMHIFIIFALFIQGIACLSIPFITHWYIILIPVGVYRFCEVFILLALVPFITSLVDARHTSVYGSISGIIEAGFAIVSSAGPLLAGPIVNRFGFTSLQVGICCVFVVFSPFILFTRRYWK